MMTMCANCGETIHLTDVPKPFTFTETMKGWSHVREKVGWNPEICQPKHAMPVRPEPHFTARCDGVLCLSRITYYDADHQWCAVHGPNGVAPPPLTLLAHPSDVERCRELYPGVRILDSLTGVDVTKPEETRTA